MLAGLIGLSVLSAGHAAADPVTLGGGSGIVVDGEAYCTLTAIGTDNRGELVGFTSAHCGGPGATVAAEGAEDAGTVGEMVAGNDALDYAVIKFDPAKVTPTNNVNGFVDQRHRTGPEVRRHRLQTGPHDRLLVRGHLGSGQGSGHHRQPGVRPAR